MQKVLESYFENFFTPFEKQHFLTMGNIPQKNSEVSEWSLAEDRFKQDLNCPGLNNFYLYLAKSASMFIDDLFNNLVDDHTFVVAANEHTTIYKNLTNTKYRLLHYNTIQNFDIESIIDSYKHSGCNKLFVYITSILEMQIVPMAFYNKLKECLVNIGIEHVIVLDDVHSMFLIPKDYDIFDYVLFTGHALLPGFEAGFLLSKDSKPWGCSDAMILNQYLDSLEILLKKRDKLYLFTTLLQQYYAEELSNTMMFKIPKNTSFSNFYLQINQPNLYNIIERYIPELALYGIHAEENLITIRGPNFVSYDPSYSIEGLVKLKNLLQKCIKLNNRM